MVKLFPWGLIQTLFLRLRTTLSIPNIFKSKEAKLRRAFVGALELTIKHHNLFYQICYLYS